MWSNYSNGYCCEVKHAMGVVNGINQLETKHSLSLKCDLVYAKTESLRLFRPAFYVNVVRFVLPTDDNDVIGCA